MFTSVLLLLLSVLIASFSQILLKMAANQTHESTLKEYLNPRVIVAYALFLVSVVLTMMSLRHVPLMLAPIIEASSYLFIAVLSYIFLKEIPNRKRRQGIAIILVGIVVAGLPL